MRLLLNRRSPKVETGGRRSTTTIVEEPGTTRVVKRTVRSLEGGGERRTTTIVQQPSAAEGALGERVPASRAMPDKSHAFMISAGLTCAAIGLASALVTTVLGLRLAFLLADANKGNAFVDFIYDLTRPLVEPFQDVFSNRSLDNGGFFEPATLVAGAMYLLAAMLLILFIWGLTTTRPRIVHTNRRDLVHGH